MGDLQHYDVEINGRNTTLRLDRAEAKKRGLTDENLTDASPRPAAKKATARRRGTKKTASAPNKLAGPEGDK